MNKLEIREETISTIIKKHKDEPELMFKLIKAKISPKELLFSLFEDDYKKKLKELEKSIQKTSKGIERDSKWKLVDRREFVKYYDDIDHTCKVRRIFTEFLPTRGASCGGTPEYVKREIWFYNWFWFRLQDLGNHIIDQQMLMWDAINFGLKDSKDKDLAITLAEQLKMIEIDKEENKLLIK